MDLSQENQNIKSNDPRVCEGALAIISDYLESGRATEQELVMYAKEFQNMIMKWDDFNVLAAIFFALIFTTRNAAVRKLPWDFLKKELEKKEERVTEYILNIMGSLQDPQFLEIAQSYKGHPNEYIRRSANEAVEEIMFAQRINK